MRNMLMLSVIIINNNKKFHCYFLLFFLCVHSQSQYIYFVNMKVTLIRIHKCEKVTIFIAYEQRKVIIIIIMQYRNEVQTHIKIKHIYVNGPLLS